MSMKETMLVLLLVAVAVLLDGFFMYFEIPVVTMDLLIMALSMLIIFGVFSPGYLSGRFIGIRSWKAATISSRIACISILLVLGIGGGAMIYLGATKPLTLYSGVRGGGHGYSLVVLGLAFMSFVISSTYLFLFNRHE